MDDIQVTRSFLPPLEEYVALLRGVWERGHLTNHGPLVLQLERRLAAHLGVKHVLFVANGTLALQLALRAVDLPRGSEVVTTPFSYVATTSSIAWEGLVPRFADIDPQHLTLDPARVERAITPGTSAILATHVYGTPCDVHALEDLAKRRNLRLIYDGAHAFGVTLGGAPICRFGDVTTLSFHATKLFHTVEGGALCTDDDALAQRIAWLRNFGHDGPERFFGLGINAKSSELHAAMGLAVFPHLPEILAARARALADYEALLFSRTQRLSRPRPRDGAATNHAYAPVILESEAALFAVRDALRAERVYPRRYFYPALSSLPYVERGDSAVAEDLARRVLCLPLSADLPRPDIERIARAALRGLGETV